MSLDADTVSSGPDRSSPEACLALVARALYERGPSPDLLGVLLDAMERWPDERLRTELLLLLQDLPLNELDAPLSARLADALARLLPGLESDLQPYGPWMLACLHGSPDWQAFGQMALSLPERPPALFGEVLLAQLLRRTLIIDPRLEALLTRTRRQLLFQSDSPAAWEGPLLLLAHQAWNNGYVWHEGRDEALRAAALQSGVDGLSPLELLKLACYRPLDGLDQARLDTLSARSPGWAALRAAAVEAPRQEAALAAALPSLNQVDPADPCGSFYTESPYPRWLAPERLGVEPLTEQLSGFFPDQDWQRLARPGIEVLVAGCGTGQQLVQQALQLPQASFTGIDLSRPALGYAARMLAAAGLSASLYQADLTRLAGWDGRFDLIACGGVLHHLADPEAGLAALVRLMAPGGLLKLGVYSRRAREPLGRLRELLGVTGAESPAEVRVHRRTILRLLPPETRWIHLTRDFYALPTCRDLLCHPREQAYALPELAGWFERQGLEVLGPEPWHPGFYALFRERFPGVPGSDLASWDLLEAEHENLFAGLIVLWLRRP